MMASSTQDDCIQPHSSGHLLDDLRRRCHRQSSCRGCRHLETPEVATASGYDDIRRLAGRVRPWTAALGDVDQRPAQRQPGMDVWKGHLPDVYFVAITDRRLLHSDSRVHLA